MLSIFRWIALIAAIVLIVALAGMFVSSQQPLKIGHQEAAEKNNQKYEAEKDNKTLWDTLFPDSISFFTLFPMVFTAVLAFAGIVQLNFLNRAERISANIAQAAKDSADVAKEALISTNRAFISPKLISALSHRYDDAKDKYWYSIIPIWENSGNTPTRDMTIYVNSYFESTPMPPDFRFPPVISSEKIPIFAGPKASFGGSFITKTSDELAEVKAGTKFFYMWGEARYRDIFIDTPEHVTRFAYQITVLGDLTKAPNEHKHSRAP